MPRILYERPVAETLGSLALVLRFDITVLGPLASAGL
jgi:hypothetical protein